MHEGSDLENQQFRKDAGPQSSRKSAALRLHLSSHTVEYVIIYIFTQFIPNSHTDLALKVGFLDDIYTRPQLLSRLSSISR